MDADAISTPTPCETTTGSDWPFAVESSGMTAAQRISEVREFALALQDRMRRISEMARVMQLASESMDPQDERCVRVCAEITQETASIADDEAEAIERACNVIWRQMAGEA